MAPEHTAPLTEGEKSFLLRAARTVIQSGLQGATATRPPETPVPLLDVAASFVSLHIGDALRGCIGTLAAREPLIDDVMDNAWKAAFADPRFPPLSPAELPGLQLEISRLTRAVPIQSSADFVLGKHGIILESASKRAVFLPQVAGEHGWDKETTLENLAHKAALDSGAWRNAGARLYIFETEKFSTTISV